MKRAARARQREELERRQAGRIFGRTAKNGLRVRRGRGPVAESLSEPERGSQRRKEVGPQLERALIAAERVGKPLLLL